MLALALLLIGFSLFSALVLVVTHFCTEHYQHQIMSRVMGLVLLCALSVLQVTHFAWLYCNYAWFSEWPYCVALFVVAPAFFLFSQPLLRPSFMPSWHPHLLWHAVPILSVPWLPNTWSMPLAFTLGACYLVRLGVLLYPLRHERVRFRGEMILLGSAFVIAVAISVLGFFQAALPSKMFFSLYAVSIGAAFMLVQMTLGLRPSLSTDVSDAVQATAYANSTLNHVDCAAVLTRLKELIEQERIYVDASLSLPALAERLRLSTHQLSELMNTRLGKGFSRYLREARVLAAKTMLCNESSASVLSVGLSVGFTSQSTFYDAFREIEGMTPGQFRKLHSLKTSN